MFDRKSYKWIYFIDNLIYKKTKNKKNNIKRYCLRICFYEIDNRKF